MRKVNFSLCFFVIVLLFVLPTGLFAESIEVGVAWAGKSGMAVRVLTGMERALNENAPKSSWILERSWQT
ncbi:MAG: hypothetical protein U9N62_00315 [Thermotogota bacterium]|nr:hypothetical protein [Thermotogota bacterium]